MKPVGICNTVYDTAIFAALKAGERILEIYLDEFEVEYKLDNSPLTIADKCSHEVIKEHLRQTSYPILSEESNRGSFNDFIKWPCYWIVDPLDGTKEFINRNGEFTVNIGLIKDKVPIFGVVYAPVKQWLYIGISGEGAWKLELENHCLPEVWKSATNKLPLKQINKKSFIVVGSRSHASRETDKYIAELEGKHAQLDFISMGSSLKICLVAEGKADIYPRLAPTMEWDTAAGDAIARSAGCKVVNFETKEPLQYNKENLLNPWFIVKR